MGTWTAEEQRGHRKLWVEALRSGKYEQARSVLRADNTSFCCLGVACDISGLGEWIGFHYLREDKLLPDQVQLWLGLNGALGGFLDGGSKKYLTDYNDGGMPFAEIADIIESEPEGLLATAEASS